MMNPNSDAGKLGLLATHGLPKPKTGLSRTVETAKTARLNKLKRDAEDVGKVEVALKHADGEKDEDVVPWKAMLINNWKDKTNDAERRASEANSSLTEREALDFRAGYFTSITHMDDGDLQDPRPMGMPDSGEGGDNNARLDWRR